MTARVCGGGGDGRVILLSREMRVGGSGRRGGRGRCCIGRCSGFGGW